MPIVEVLGVRGWCLWEEQEKYIGRGEGGGIAWRRCDVSPFGDMMLRCRAMMLCFAQ